MVEEDDLAFDEQDIFAVSCLPLPVVIAVTRLLDEGIDQRVAQVLGADHVPLPCPADEYDLMGIVALSWMTLMIRHLPVPLITAVEVLMISAGLGSEAAVGRGSPQLPRQAPAFPQDQIYLLHR